MSLSTRIRAARNLATVEGNPALSIELDPDDYYDILSHTEFLSAFDARDRQARFRGLPVQGGEKSRLVLTEGDMSF